MRLINEGLTQCRPGSEDKLTFVGPASRPYATLRRGEIPGYIDDEFYSMYAIWNNSRLTGTLPMGQKGWAEIPQYLTDIIATFQNAFDHIKAGA